MDQTPIRASFTAPVSVMIFTLDEEINLPSCLESLKWCDDIILVDSFSKDQTVEIARKSNARVFQHTFSGFGEQRNWALANTFPKHDWILILDADEKVPGSLVEEMAGVLKNIPESIAAFRIRRRFHMWGRWLRYSSLYPTWVVRLVRKDRIKFINRGHAETQQVDGKIMSLDCDLVDENLKGIDEWLVRQNSYSQKDAEYEITLEREPINISEIFSQDPLIRRAALKRLVIRMPARPLLYFIYSYILRGGFLDGKDGLAFCMMKAIYQGLIVARKHDLRRRTR